MWVYTPVGITGVLVIDYFILFAYTDFCMCLQIIMKFRCITELNRHKLSVTLVLWRPFTFMHTPFNGHFPGNQLPPRFWFSFCFHSEHVHHCRTGQNISCPPWHHLITFVSAVPWTSTLPSLVRPALLYNVNINAVCSNSRYIIRPRRSRRAAAYSHQTFPWTFCRSVCLSVQCIVEKRQIAAGSRSAP